MERLGSDFYDNIEWVERMYSLILRELNMMRYNQVLVLTILMMRK